MAKEKFVRSKPHVNIGSWLKQKLGFGATPGEPPIEPLESDNQKGMAFNAEEALGASAIKDTDGDGLPEVEDGWQEPLGASALALPSTDVALAGDEIADLPAEGAADPDRFSRVNVQFANLPAGDGGPTEITPAGAPSEEIVGASPKGEIYFTSVQGGGSMEGGLEGPGLLATEQGARNAGPLAEGDPSDADGNDDASVWMPAGQLSVPGSMSEPDELPLSTGQIANVAPPEDALEGVDADTQAEEKDPLTTFLFGLKISGSSEEEEPGNHATPEVDDEVLLGFEHGDVTKPVVVGGLWNTKEGSLPDDGLEADGGSDVEIKHEHVYQHNQTDLQFLNQKAGVDGDPDRPLVIEPAPNPAEETSTLAELKVSEQLVPLDSDEGGEGDGLEDLVRELPELGD